MKLVESAHVIEVTIGENDVIVLETDRKLTAASKLHLLAEWSNAIRDQRVVVLDGGVRAKVIRNASITINGDDEVA